MVGVRNDRYLPSQVGGGFVPHVVEAESEQADDRLFSGGNYQVVIRSFRRDAQFMSEGNQPVGDAGFCRYDYNDVIAGVIRIDNAFGNQHDCVGGFKRGTAVFLDNESHVFISLDSWKYFVLTCKGHYVSAAAHLRHQGNGVAIRNKIIP